MRSPSTVVTQLLVVVTALGGVAGQVVYLDALWWHTLGIGGVVGHDVGPGLLTVLVGHAVVSVACSLLATRLVLHDGEHAAPARTLAIAFAAWSYLMAYSGVTIALAPEAGSPRGWFDAHFLLVEALGLAGLLRFTAVFPRPVRAFYTGPEEPMPPALRLPQAFTLVMLRPEAPWVGAVAVVCALWIAAAASGAPLADAGMGAPMNAVRVSAAALVVLNLLRSWNLSDSDDRERLRWLGVGLAILGGAIAVVIGGTVLFAVGGFPRPAVAWHPVVLDMGQIGFFWGFAAAPLGREQRALVVIRRAVTVASVAASGLFLAAALEALLDAGFSGFLTLPTGSGTVLALGATATLYPAIVRLVGRVVPEA